MSMYCLETEDEFCRFVGDENNIAAANCTYILPVQVLLAIFAPLNKQDLAAVRLTSKHLDDVA